MLRKVPSAKFLLFAAVLLFPSIAFAAGEDPSIPLLLYLVVILLAAMKMFPTKVCPRAVDSAIPFPTRGSADAAKS